MEDEGSLGLVLARATELRLKIGNCIHTATTTSKLEREHGDEEEEDEGEEVVEAQRLVSICDALESLESQLSSLQGLQQQQRYEREVALGEIEQSRKALLDKLKGYRGEEALDVINEASAFAGETVERHSDLMLPPYPTPPPHSLRRDNGNYRNGAAPPDHANGGKNPTSSNKTPSGTGTGLGSFLGVVAKAVFTIVGVVSVLSLSGLGPEFARREKNPLKILGLFRVQHVAGGEERPVAVKCPPGKVLVVHNGEARCLVKERVEVPFTSAAVKPDVNYGCG